MNCKGRVGLPMIRVHHDEIRILRKRRVYVRIPPPSLMTNQEDTTSEWTLDEGVRAFIYCTAVFSPPYQSSASAQADPEKTSVQVRSTVFTTCFVGLGSALGSLPRFARLACGSYLPVSKRRAFVP
jgi:hypothetical protein